MSVKMLSMNTFHYLRGKLLDVWKLPSEFVTDSKYIEFNTNEIEVKALSTCFYFKPKFIGTSVRRSSGRRSGGRLLAMT